MSPAQTALYFREWGLARAWFVAHGLTAAQADAKRHELHTAALGRAKSSKDFNNADLDRVLAKFRAVHDGGNLDAQLHADESPEERRRDMLHRCERVLWECGQLGDARFLRDEVCERYLAGTCRKVIGREVAECDAAQLAKVLGCLTAMLVRQRKKNPVAAAQLKEFMARKLSESPF